MKFVVFSALSLLVSVVSAFHIVPPASITTCGPLTIEYDTRTGIAPFSLAFHSDSATGPIVAAFTDITGTSFTWDQVTIPAGTNIVIVLGDSRGLGSATPVITVGAGSSDVCLNNPTSVPALPSVTSEHPPTSSFDGSSSSSSSSLSSSSLSSSTTSGTSSESSSTDLSSSLSSLSSLISSASSLASSLTVTTSTPGPSATGGLSDNGAMIPGAAGVFTIGVITAFVGALLA